ncbi:tautomerase family protein [Knoellia sp. CPCC 206435]
MPLVDVTLVEGRTPTQLRALVTALTDAVVTAIEAPRDSVRVVLREVPTTHWAAGDVTVAERPSPSDAVPDQASGGGTAT